MMTCNKCDDYFRGRCATLSDIKDAGKLITKQTAALNRYILDEDSKLFKVDVDNYLLKGHEIIRSIRPCHLLRESVKTDRQKAMKAIKENRYFRCLKSTINPLDADLPILMAKYNPKNWSNTESKLFVNIWIAYLQFLFTIRNIGIAQSNQEKNKKLFKNLLDYSGIAYFGLNSLVETQGLNMEKSITSKIEEHRNLAITRFHNNCSKDLFLYNYYLYRAEPNKEKRKALAMDNVQEMFVKLSLMPHLKLLSLPGLRGYSFVIAKHLSSEHFRSNKLGLNMKVSLENFEDNEGACSDNGYSERRIVGKLDLDAKNLPISNFLIDWEKKIITI